MEAVSSEFGQGPVSALAAAILAAVLLWAAMAKLGARSETADDFAALGLRRSKLLAVAVPVLELVIAAVLLIAPKWGGPVAVALLVVFTTIIARVLRNPDHFGEVSCACFGGSSQKPLSWRQLARNSGLLVLAVLAAFLDGPVWSVL